MQSALDTRRAPPYAVGGSDKPVCSPATMSTAESRMDSRERVRCAMRHLLPDRVPVFCQLALGHYFLHGGIAPHEIWFTTEGFAQALVRLQQRYRFDGILVNLPGRPPDLLSRVRQIDATDEGTRLLWADGSCTTVPPDDNPQHRLATQASLPRADFARLDPDRLDALDALAGYWWNVCHVPWIDGKTSPGLLRQIPAYFGDTIDRVRALTRRGMGGASSTIKHGPLVYDQAGRVATIDGRMVELSARELGLLEVLLQRAGRLVSKDQLVERLCEWGEEVSNNAIEVYIHRLRKKIEKGPIRIATVRGLGYCLEKIPS